MTENLDVEGAPTAEPFPPPDPAPRQVDRTPGPHRAAWGTKTRNGKPIKRDAPIRKAPARTAETRTAADVPRPELEMEAAPPPQVSYSNMPRDTEAFEPEYDGTAKRLSREDRDTNQFEIPSAVRRKLTNAGWDWCWQVITIFGQPVDGTQLMIADNAGWRPAKAKNFPELVPRGTSPDSVVERHGQRFFIRPAHMTMKAKQEDYDFAQAQMNGRMQATRAGVGIGENGGPSLADMGRVVQPVPITFEMEGEFGSHS